MFTNYFWLATLVFSIVAISTLLVVYNYVTHSGFSVPQNVQNFVKGFLLKIATECNTTIEVVKIL